ncbi:hypothetical protein FRB96_001101 [Tulasnella sp. 330]|nr:hypothetical protein FRB96_001101 [Tulasnella sp. 330]KAG8875710.1 hypothetical protein FRB97_004791 [Tulasnella sp. 331]KAG8881455.1 hypothetical protein FRB98_004355 [Tulasnella sp. 332]
MRLNCFLEEMYTVSITALRQLREEFGASHAYLFEHTHTLETEDDAPDSDQQHYGSPQQQHIATNTSMPGDGFYHSYSTTLQEYLPYEEEIDDIWDFSNNSHPSDGPYIPRLLDSVFSIPPPSLFTDECRNPSTGDCSFDPMSFSSSSSAVVWDGLPMHIHLIHSPGLGPPRFGQSPPPTLQASFLPTQRFLYIPRNLLNTVRLLLMKGASFQVAPDKSPDRQGGRNPGTPVDAPES